MDQKLTFTAFLRDEYSKKFDKLAETSDDALAKIARDLDALSQSGNRVGKTINDIDRRMALLRKASKMTVDTKAIKFAQDEIKALQKEKDKLEGTGGGGIGIGRGFAIAGVAMAAGAAMKQVAMDAVDATAKYQKFEAILTTSFGNKSQAQAAMRQIEDFAKSTPYQVDELTEAYVRLRNRGFNPSLDTLTKIGDLAASQGKGFMQVTEAMLDAPQKQFIRLQESLGVDVQSMKGGRLRFVGLGQDRIIKDDPEEIKKLVLEFGALKGVTGSMSSISKTTGGAISNLSDNVDLLYKNLGDRFRPEIDATISVLNSMVSSVKDWVAIPASQKVQDEISAFQKLRVELGDSNIKEERRKQILEEVKKISPDVVDATKNEKEQLDNLNTSLDTYIGKRRQQLALMKANENIAADLGDLASARERYAGGRDNILGILARMDDPNVLQQGNIQDQVNYALRTLKSKAKQEIVRVEGGTGNAYTMQNNTEAILLQQLQNELATVRKSATDINRLQSVEQKAKKNMANIDALFGITPNAPEDKKKEDPKIPGSTTGSTVSSIAGGQRITHVTTNIQNLVAGGVNLHATTINESLPQIKDAVVGALLTAVNDTNLVAQ